MHQYEHIISEFHKCVKQVFTDGVNQHIQDKTTYHDERRPAPFHIPKENFFERPIALENIKQLPCVFFVNGLTRRNEQIATSTNDVGETTEVLVNVAINPIGEKGVIVRNIIQRSSDARETMRRIIAASQRIGQTTDFYTTKEVRLRRAVPFTPRRDRRAEKEFDRELLLFIVEIDYTYNKWRIQ